ncbi:MAG TPA: hypothetical protein VFA46_08610 [Actinomycetes bacterium]|nr:hypothetical protein [Actinomycetes bacterium]
MAREQQSSRRICVEHAVARAQGVAVPAALERYLQRWIGCREYYAQTHLAVARLASDRTRR